MKWRTVVSLSISARNPDAALVAERLADQGIPIGRGGKQILAWAAAYLSGATNQVVLEVDDPGISDDELDARLDEF